MLAIFLPRGIRNNNPGNLRLSKTVWQGQAPVQSDKAFVEFVDALSGLRALMKTLVTYYLKYNLDTVECIINRFAPPHENATDSYIHQVARALNVKRTDKINLLSKAALTALASAIVLHENGTPPAGRPPGWYGKDLYDQAADMILPERKSVYAEFS